MDALEHLSSQLAHTWSQLSALTVAAIFFLLGLLVDSLLRRTTTIHQRLAARFTRDSKHAPQGHQPDGRPWGRWPPSSFQRPRAAPYPGFDLAATKPLPYRPFRYGPKYAVNMGLRAMAWDDWIELDSDFPAFHATKAARIADRGAKCSRTAPDAMPAALELLDELTTYLPERYPSVFAPLRDGRRGMRNTATGEEFDVGARPLCEDPMQMAARMVQDDLVIMLERPDGQYYLQAGSVLLAGFWRLQDKFGMPLSEIHTSGNVAHFRERLEKGMLTFFRRLKPDAPVLRNNYFLQMDDNLAWSATLGPEDEGSTQQANWGRAVACDDAEKLWFRSERQSLRRLPKSGGIVFTIRVYFHPLPSVASEPYVPGRLASGIRSWTDDVASYKGRDKYEALALEYLDRKHEEQLANGLDLSKEDEVRSYPW